MKRPALVALRLIVGVGALAYLIRTIDLDLARRTLASADVRWLLASFGAQVFAKGFWLLRWNALLSPGGHAQRMSRLLHHVLVGLFFNNFLPSSVGGDVMRGVGLYRDGVPRAAAAASVLLDRLVGLTALAAMACVGGALGQVLWPGQGPWPAAMGFALGAGVLIVFLTRPLVLSRVSGFPGLPEALRSRLRRLLEAMAAVSGARRVSGKALLLSLGLSASSAFFHWSVARSLAIDIPLLVFFVIVPTVMLAASLPITLNGLGIRELGFVAFLGAQGVPASTAAVFAFLVFALPLVFALAGGVLFLAGGRSRAIPEESR